MRTLHLTITLLCLFMYSQPAAAAEVELQNDGFVSNMTAGFQAGFVIGEIGAVRLDPPGGGPFRLLKVSLLFGGAATSHDVTLHIWTNGDSTPGTELYKSDFTLTGSDQALSVIDLSAANVMINGSFWVGIEFQHAGAPSIARDDDGTIKDTHNFVFAIADNVELGWFQSNILGLTGDWVIRATIDDNSGPVPDAGVGQPPDAAVGGPDAGGDECQVHSECPTGQYCGGDNQCTYDCRVDTDCSNNMRCTSQGMCEMAPKGGGCDIATSGPGHERAPWGLPWAMMLLLAAGVLLLARRRRENH